MRFESEGNMSLNAFLLMWSVAFCELQEESRTTENGERLNVFSSYYPEPKIKMRESLPKALLINPEIWSPHHPDKG